MFIHLLLLISFFSPPYSGDFRKNDVHRMHWNQLPVTWLESSSGPRKMFYAEIVFQEGAMGDDEQNAGLTEQTIQMLFKGTKKYSPQQMSEFFDQYAIQLDHRVTHESTVISVSGPIQYMPKALERICHLFQEADFPRSEWASLRKKSIADLKQLPTNHQALAERVFRQLLTKGSSFSLPTEGTLNSLTLLSTTQMKERWKTLRDKTPKKMYLSGPREVLFSKDLIINQCGLKTTGLVEQHIKFPLTASGHKIFFLPLNSANQAQIRIGKFLSTEEAKDPYEIKSFASDLIGGGFISLLMQEIRVKRGLTYSLQSYFSPQSQYGRSGIMTFTKTDSVIELLNVLKNQLLQLENSQNIQKNHLSHMKSFAIGHYPLQFEGDLKFLKAIIHRDHLHLPLPHLYEFPKMIERITEEDLSKAIRQLFGWDEQVILILGHPQLKDALRTIREVEVLNINDFI